ncbi:MAG: endonuclease [Bacteroidales bacterium]|nr:endonuclease [Bacteroidales bacterium]MDZ4205580.1 endonuclease [Bacteroidales bacterium]
MIKKLLTAIFLLSVFTLIAQPPAGYYDQAMGLTGIALQDKLHLIIKDHTVQTYASLYQHFQTTDRKPNNIVWDMYSDVPGGIPPYVYYYNSGNECGNYSAEGHCYNREHSFPKSWFGGDIMPMYSDLFHLYPTDGYVNNRRANYPFGTISSASWTSMNGSKVGPCNYPGYAGVVFEPINEYKGDFARTMFYMAVRYHSQDASWPGSPMVDRSQLKPWALALMKVWHQTDPVSAKEINRNNAVFGIQNNRNPFIDHPEFVNAIWGSPAAISQPESLAGISVFPVPASDFCVINYGSYFSPGQFTVSLFDMTGRNYNAHVTGEGDVIRLDISSLKQGFYMIGLNEPGKIPVYTRLIKQ